MLEAFFEHISSLVGINKEFIIAPFFIFASALIGSSVALWAVISNRKTARLNNSMDFINRYGIDKDVLAHEQLIHSKLKELSTDGVRKFAQDDESNSDEAKSIRYILNYYESMAICIHRKIYDDEIIKEAMFSTFTEIWRICEPYVKERRRLKEKTTMFQETEYLIKKWLKKGLAEKCRKWYHPCKYLKTSKTE